MTGPCSHAQHPPRCTHHRLLPRSRGNQLLIVDKEFARLAREALPLMKSKASHRHRLCRPRIPIDGERLGKIDYEHFVASGDPAYDWLWPEDEWEAISLNLYQWHDGEPQGRRLSPSRRLSARQGNVLTGGMGKHPVYLWTLPMFHCNGWCFPGRSR